MVEVLRRGMLGMRVRVFGGVFFCGVFCGDGGIEEGFFPQKARKRAAVLTSRILFGMTGIYFEV